MTTPEDTPIKGDMLTIRRHTPSTVVYSVSTRAESRSITGYAVAIVVFLSRIIACLAVGIALYLEYQHHFNSAPNQYQLSLKQTALKLPFAQTLARSLPSIVIDIGRTGRLILYAGVAWLVSRKGYTEESLLVIRGLGVQTATSGSNYVWAGSTRFIPTTAIQDIFIYEAFKGFEVRFFLCIVVEGEEEVVVVFPSILPRREVLETVWRGTRSCLYEPKT